MKSYFPILFFVFMIFSCSGKNRIPNGVLSQKEMESVLWDLFRADEFLTAYVFQADSTLNKKKETIRYYEEIFKLHQINKGTFQKSFSFYESHPELMKQLLDSLNAKGNVDNQHPEGTAIPDSSLMRKIHPKMVD